MSPSLYAAVLGDRFAELGPTLRGFHGQREGGRARGQVRVTHGASALARVAAWLMRAPKAGEGVDVQLAVHVDSGRALERWDRSFDGHALRTRQWRAGPHLVEAVGPIYLHFDLRVDGGAMTFEHRRTSVLGLPLPRALSPRVTAQVADSEARAGQWLVDVRIALPLVGLVVRYTGAMDTLDPQLRSPRERA